MGYIATLAALHSTFVVTQSNFKVTRINTKGWLADQVEKRKGDLLNYIIFLRVTPLLPNIFINIASPVVNVPILPFALGELHLYHHFIHKLISEFCKAFKMLIC